MDKTEKTRSIIANNKYFVMATYGSENSLWTCPLTYVVDENYDFYIVTALDSTHVENIKKNPRIAFTIFDSTLGIDDIDAVQANGIIGQVDNDDLPSVVKMYYEQAFPDPKVRSEWEAPVENFMKDDFPCYRFFQIKVMEIYKRDTENTDIDRRVKIDIEELKKEAAKHPTLNEIK